jgi:hypothetical protein
MSKRDITITFTKGVTILGIGVENPGAGVVMQAIFHMVVNRSLLENENSLDWWV